MKLNTHLNKFAKIWNSYHPKQCYIGPWGGTNYSLVGRLPGIGYNESETYQAINFKVITIIYNNIQYKNGQRLLQN